MWAFIIMALGGLAVIAGAYFQYRNRIDDQKSALTKEQRRLRESEQRAIESEVILKKATKIISSQKEVIDQTQKIVGLQEELAKKNGAIIDLQNKAIAQITGGEGVPKVYFWVSPSNLTVLLQNDTELPIKSVSVSVERHVLDYAIEHNEKHPGNVAVPRYAELDEDIKLDNLYNGDIGIGFVKNIKEWRFEKAYKKIRYDYIVRWQNGFYEGTFTIEPSEKDLAKITQDWIWTYTKGYEYGKAVRINYQYSNFNQEPAIDPGRSY